MALTPEQKLKFLSRAKESWLTAETIIYAYDRALNVEKRRRDLIKYGTIVAALLTALIGFTNVTWLTVAAALFTAGLAAVEKAFAPSESLQKYWECKVGLHQVKEDLTTFCSITIERVQDLQEGEQPFREVSKQILTTMQKIPFTEKKEDRTKAQEAFEGTSIAQDLQVLNERRAMNPLASS